MRAAAGRGMGAVVCEWKVRYKHRLSDILLVSRAITSWQSSGAGFPGGVLSNEEMPEFHCIGSGSGMRLFGAHGESLMRRFPNPGRPRDTGDRDSRITLTNFGHVSRQVTTGYLVTER